MMFLRDPFSSRVPSGYIWVPMPLSHYQRVISDPEDIPVEQLRRLFLELLQRLDLQIIEEATPDYCSYEIVRAGE